MTDLVKITIKDHVADVRLNRPTKMNALTTDLMSALADAANVINKDKSVRAVVLSGEGKAFCAGLDTSVFSTDLSSLDEFTKGSASYPNSFQRPAYVWKQLDVPVVCAMHGVALGGGLQIALGADIRIAAPDTKLSVMEIKWGIIPDMSASQTLRDLVRLDVAKELIYTGRVLAAEEGEKLGLVTRLSDTPYEDAHALATTIASKNPDAIAAAKRLLNESWHGDDLDGLQMEEKLQSKVFTTNNYKEALASEMQSRPANFKDRL